MRSNVLPFPRPGTTPAPAPVLPAIAAAVAGNGFHPVAQEIVTAAIKSWMDGDPLTQREQRIVDLVLDNNYFGQLGRLAMGA